MSQYLSSLALQASETAENDDKQGHFIRNLSKGNEYTFKGSNSALFIFASLVDWGQLRGNNLLP